jgi:hypothetical protein
LGQSREFVCRAQLKAQATGQRLTIPSPEVCEKTAVQHGTEPFGVDEWPRWVRMMDRLDPSYRT